MKQEFRKEIIKAIETTRESAKNSFEIALDSYAEIMSKLDFMTYILINEEKNSH